MKKLIFIAFLAMVVQTSYSQDTLIRKDIVKLMELTGAGKMGMQAMEQMVVSFKQYYSGIPDEFWDEFMKRFDSNELIQMIIPIYEKHYTHEDILGLIEFYQTPLGQKMIAVLPSISKESMEAGQKWGMKVGMQIAEDLEKEGYKKE